MKLKLKLVIAAVFFVGCQAGSEPEPVPAPSESCQNFRAIGDLSISFSYLDNLFSCINDEGDEPLAHIASIHKTVGEEGFQAWKRLLIDSTETQPKLAAAYPYLLAFSTLLDRGLFDYSGNSLAERSDRYDTLQTVLKQLNPKPLAQLTLHWAHEGNLAPILEDFGHLIDELPPASISGYLRLYLSDPDFHKNLTQAANRLLKDELNRDAIFETLQWRSFPLFSNDAILDCLDGLKACESVDSSHSFLEHLSSFWSSLTPSERSSLATSLGEMIRTGLSADTDTVEYYIENLAITLTDFGQWESEPTTSIARILSVLVETDLPSIAPLMAGFERIRNNPTYFSALQEKQGSTLLHEKIEDFLWNGGPVSSCNTMYPGVRDSADHEDLLARLRDSTASHASCANGTSLLAAFIRDTLNVACEQNCSEVFAQTIENSPTPDYWDKTMGLLLNEMERSIRFDPYYFRSARLGYEAINQSDINLIKRILSDSPVTDAEAFVRFADKTIMHQDLRKKLAPDFWSRWLIQSLSKYSELSYHFSDLYSSKQEVDESYKINRILSGVYPSGPVEQHLQERLSPNAISQMAPATLDIQSKDVSAIMFPGYSSSSYIKNKSVSFKPTEETIRFPYSGAVVNPITISDQGAMQKPERDQEAAFIFMPNGNKSWSVFNRFWDTLALSTSELIGSEAQNFGTWAKSDLKSQLETNFIQPAVTIAPPEDVLAMFQKAEELPPDIVRSLAFYVSHHFITPTRRIEGIDWAETGPRLNKNAAIRAAFGPSLLYGTEKTWQAYRDHLPRSLRNPDSLRSMSLQWTQATTINRFKEKFSEAASNPATVIIGAARQDDSPPIDEQYHELSYLLALTGVYESRDELFLQPLVSQADICPRRPENQWIPSSCPGKLPTDQAFGRFLKDQTLLYLCPFFDDALFTREFQRLMSESMNFTESIEQLHSLCLPMKTQSEYSALVSAKSLESSITTLLTVGSQPKIETEILNIPNEIKRYQLAMHAKPSRYSLRDALSTQSFENSKTNATLNQQTGLYKNFISAQPNFIDYVISQVKTNSDSNNFSEALVNLSDENFGVTVTSLPELFDTILFEFDKSLYEGDSLLKFITKIGIILGQDEEKAGSFLRVFAKPHDPYFGILLGYTFPQAIRALVFRDFNWDNPDYRLAKEILKPGNLLLLRGLTSVLDTEGGEIFKTFVRVVSTFPDQTSWLETMNRVISWFSNSLAASSSNTDLDLVKSATAIRHSSNQSLTGVLAGLFLNLGEPIADLSNDWQPSSGHNFNQLASSFLTHGIPMFAKIQKAYNSAPPVFSDAILGMMLDEWNMEHGIVSLAMLQDARIGFRQPNLYSNLFKSEAMRKDLQLGLQSIYDIDAQLWLASTDEMTTLLSEASSITNLLLSDSTIDPEIETDLRFLLAVLNRQADNQGENLELNVSVLKNWLTTNVDEEETR